MFRGALLILIFSGFIQVSVAQKLEGMGLETRWSKGRLIIDNGRELTGFIRLNELQGKISYKQDEQDDNQVFNLDEVIFLIYFDEETNAERKFYRYSFGRVDDNGEETTHLLEVVREFPDFQLLSGKTELIVTMVSNMSKTPSKKRPVLSQNEYIYFCHYDSIPEPYLGIARGNSTKEENYLKKYGRVINKKVPKKYFGQQWSMIRQYIQREKINFSSKGGLMKVLDYYATQVSPK